MENAFVLLGSFSKEARRAGMEKEKINEIIKEATSRDYEHLVKTLDDTGISY